MTQEVKMLLEEVDLLKKQLQDSEAQRNYLAIQLSEKREDVSLKTDNKTFKKKRKTVIFDFDGVIHSYESGWKGASVIADAPVLGIKEEIKRIREKYKVVVVSTRCYQEGGIEAIKSWLNHHNIIVDDVTSEKPPAILTVDDRAICFDGTYVGLLEKIEAFKPWTK